MIREAQIAVEEEMQLATERYKVCLARMEMERTALDEKLSQRDAEITKLSTTLEELRSSVETQVTTMTSKLMILPATRCCHDKLSLLGKF